MALLSLLLLNFLFCKQISSFRRVSHGTIPPSFGYPYMNHVRLTNGAICTGILISNRIILTAGHCLVGQGTTKISYGSYDEWSMSSVLSEQLIIHPEYHLEQDHIDMGLVIAAQEIPLSDNIQVIGVGRWKIDTEHIENEPVLICGWGIDQDKNIDGLRCTNYRDTDQNCLAPSDSIEVDWCFYANKDADENWQMGCSVNTFISFSSIR